MKGKIVKGIGGFYYVKTPDNIIYECKARGIFRKEKIKPCIGDNVEISVENGKGSIDKIYPRASYMIRPPVANVEILVIVIAASEPAPDLFLTDKLLVNAHIAGIEPIICVNKTDLKKGTEIIDTYCRAGYKCIGISAKDNSGICELLPYIEGKTSAFAGLSGVGKSTLLNLITNSENETGSVSEKIKRGRHTTRHVELLELEQGGYVLDTPGFSSFEVTPIPAGELSEHFQEMQTADTCRFKGCAHINEPDCAVKKLLFDGEISKSRYESYVTMYNYLKNIKEWEN